jgi:HJR/Mrr/RecB family endonuclease
MYLLLASLVGLIFYFAALYLSEPKVARSNHGAKTFSSDSQPKATASAEPANPFSEAVRRVGIELSALHAALSAPSGLSIRVCDLQDRPRLAKNLVNQACKNTGIDLPSKLRQDLESSSIQKLTPLLERMIARRAKIIEAINCRLIVAEQKLYSFKRYSEVDASAMSKLRNRSLEREVLRVLTAAGFKAYWPGEKGHDFGADLVITSPIQAVIQCKGWKGKVSNDDVLKTVGSASYYRSEVVIVLGTGGFTSSAHIAAGKCREEVFLFDSAQFLSWVNQKNKSRDVEFAQLRALRDELKTSIEYFSHPNRTLGEIHSQPA